MSKTQIVLTLIFVCAIASQSSQAQSTTGIPMTPITTMSAGGQQPPAGSSVLVLGAATSVSYDTNALDTQKPVPATQYTFYPQIGLNTTGARWASSLTYMPGLSYSSSDIPSYSSISQMLDATLQYRATRRLTLQLRNYFLYSSNPFDSLRGGSVIPPVGGANGPTMVAGDYLPQTNEQATLSAAYELTARTSLQMTGAYTYFGYQNNAADPASVLFQQSSSGAFTFGLLHAAKARYSYGVQYIGQLLDAGSGSIRTQAHAIGYQFQFSPKPNLQLSAMIGPQYLDSTYRLQSGAGTLALFPNGQNAGWSWMGAGTISWTRQGNGISASIIRQLSIGNQYQGPVRQILANVQVHRQIGSTTVVNAFAGYNINEPPFSAKSIARLSNNYFSAGAGINHQFNKKWVLGVTYWYTMQDRPLSVDQAFYSGDHNRVAVSLSYVIAKPIRR